MVRYVTEEVDRVRDLFQAKEHKLSVDRDAAKEEVAASMKQCSSLNEELTSLNAQLQALKEENNVSVAAMETACWYSACNCRVLFAFMGRLVR